MVDPESKQIANPSVNNFNKSTKAAGGSVCSLPESPEKLNQADPPTKNIKIIEECKIEVKSEKRPPVASPVIVLDGQNGREEKDAQQYHDESDQSESSDSDSDSSCRSIRIDCFEN